MTKLGATLSIEDSDSIAVYDLNDSLINFADLVKESFIDMPPALACEWAAKLEMFAHMLRDYAENGQPAVCFPSSGTEDEC